MKLGNLTSKQILKPSRIDDTEVKPQKEKVVEKEPKTQLPKETKDETVAIEARNIDIDEIDNLGKPVDNKPAQNVKAEPAPVEKNEPKPEIKQQEVNVAEAQKTNAPKLITATANRVPVAQDAPATTRAAANEPPAAQDNTASAINNAMYQNIQEQMAKLKLNQNYTDEQRAEIISNMTRATGIKDETQVYGNYVFTPIKNEDGATVGYSYLDKDGKTGEVNMMNFDRIARNPEFTKLKETLPVIKDTYYHKICGKDNTYYVYLKNPQVKEYEIKE